MSCEKSFLTSNRPLNGRRRLWRYRQGRALGLRATDRPARRPLRPTELQCPRRPRAARSASRARAGAPLRFRPRQSNLLAGDCAEFVELDIFFEALERGVAGKLLEPGDMHPLGDPAQIAPRRRLWPAKAAPSSPARPVHFLTTSATSWCRSDWYQLSVAGGDRRSDGALRHPRRRQPPEPAKQRPFADPGGAEPGFERWTGQRSVRPAGSHTAGPAPPVVLAPRQEHRDAVSWRVNARPIEPPVRSAAAPRQNRPAEGAIPPPGQSVGDLPGPRRATGRAPARSFCATACGGRGGCRQTLR